MADDEDKAVPNPECKIKIVHVDGSVGFAVFVGRCESERTRLQSESFRAWGNGSADLFLSLRAVALLSLDASV